MAHELASILAIPLVSSMGKYLNIPSIQVRVKKSTYLEVLERVQQKLQGWKAECLSLAARTTLIKSVTLTMPSYVMQTALLPKSITDSIDKCQ